jgi:nucleotide-binding universal stress UspA family protein
VTFGPATNTRPVASISALDVECVADDGGGGSPLEKGELMVMTDAEVDSASTPSVDRGTWVVGLDGSDCAANALEWAATNAKGRAAEVRLVTAWQTPVVGAYPMSAPLAVAIDDTELHDAAAHDVAVVAADLDSRLDLPVTASVGHGGPAEVLLEASESASVLVIGSRGRGGFARLLLGSTSTQCATHASVPTIVVPGDAEPEQVETILVGCDGSPNSMVALRWAIDFAAPGSTVVVSWVWDATPLAVGADAFFFPDASDLAAERFHHLVDTVAGQARARDVRLVREFVRGTPRSALASQAEKVDLVAVGARGHGAIGAALLGSVSTWLLHHVHRPIAVVPLKS